MSRFHVSLRPVVNAAVPWMFRQASSVMRTPARFAIVRPGIARSDTLQSVRSIGQLFGARSFMSRAVISDSFQLSCKQPRWGQRFTSTLAEAVAKQAPVIEDATVSRLCKPGTERAIGYWLAGSAGLIFVMVLLGGYTRLRRAGLSMTSWKPLGSLPPQSAEEWEKEFERYKSFPEYRTANQGMTVHQFKYIYYVEWAHRMWGRMLGLVFIVPFTYFAARGYIKKPLLGRLSLMFAMGGAQGLIGWWMVKSGLEEPKNTNAVARVSPYRLATHLISAFGIYGYVLWNAMTLLRPAPAALHSTAEAIRQVNSLRRFALPVCLLVGLTAFSGAFVAGLDAGHAYNDWPLMAGDFIPEGILNFEPLWTNFFENTATVQFDHRMLAYTTLAAVTALFVRGQGKPLHPSVRKALHSLIGMTYIQALIGISTLMMYVPVHLGVSHQGGALATLSFALYVLHTLRRPTPAALKQIQQSIQAAAKAV